MRISWIGCAIGRGATGTIFGGHRGVRMTMVIGWEVFVVVHIWEDVSDLRSRPDSVSEGRPTFRSCTYRIVPLLCKEVILIILVILIVGRLKSRVPWSFRLSRAVTGLAIVSACSIGASKLRCVGCKLRRRSVWVGVSGPPRRRTVVRIHYRSIWEHQKPNNAMQCAK